MLVVYWSLYFYFLELLIFFLAVVDFVFPIMSREKPVVWWYGGLVHLFLYIEV